MNITYHITLNFINQTIQPSNTSKSNKIVNYLNQHSLKLIPPSIVLTAIIQNYIFMDRYQVSSRLAVGMVSRYSTTYIARYWW